MNREMPSNPESSNFAGENSEKQKAPDQKSKELTDQEKTDLAFKKTVNEFKNIAKENPITKGIKKILGK